MNYRETFTKPTQVDSLRELRIPNPDDFERNFARIFTYADSGKIMQPRREVLSYGGDIVARFWPAQPIQGLELMAELAPEMRQIPLLVKNPFNLPEQIPLVGKRSGLAVLQGIAFAVGIKSKGRFARPVAEEYQQPLVDGYQRFMSQLGL